MAWDTQRTRQLLLDAGVDEFSRYGLAGGRIDRIAAAAGVNKERIYQYFGSKDRFFDSVLAGELDVMFDAVPLAEETPDDLIRYCLDLFDFYGERPNLARLLHWEGLERGARLIELDSPRTRRSQSKAAAIARALGADYGAGANFFLNVIALATSWQVTPQLTRMFLAAEDATAEREVRRAAFGHAVTALVRAAQRPANHEGSVAQRGD